MANSEASLVPRTCEQCGEGFKARRHQVKTGGGRYCSLRCRALAQPRDPLDVRLWTKVNRSGGDDACHPFMGSRNADGYGHIGVGGGKIDTTHRVAYRLCVGPLAPGARVLHKCDNPPCCNPRHLFLGTQAANVADMIAKGRHVAPKGAASGNAKLNDEQVRAIRSSPGVATLKGRHSLAVRYGVSFSTISGIHYRRSWKHIE